MIPCNNNTEKEKLFSSYCEIRIEYEKVQAEINQITLLLEQNFWETLKKGGCLNIKDIGEAIAHIASSSSRIEDAGGRLLKNCTEILSQIDEENRLTGHKIFLDKE